MCTTNHPTARLIVLQRADNVSSGIKQPGLETSPGLTSYGLG